jgi:hypothetical protein
MSDALSLNCIALIREAAASPAMRAKAAPIAAALIADAFLPQDRGGIRPSAYGKCRLALWASVHGLDDLEPDPIDNVLAKMDLGTLVGAWEAALLKVAAECNDEWDVCLEYVPEGGGHIDALCVRAGGMSHVVEFKSQWSSGAIPNPEKDSPQHLLQAGDYAIRTQSPRFTLVYIRPAAPAGARMKQFEYDAAPYATLVAIERDRLAPALLDEPPTPDPQNRWSCSTCSYGACSKNKSKSADSADLLFA